MRFPLEEHPYSQELLRARQLSAAHDEMKRMINGVIIPEFNSIIQVFIKASYPWDIKVHGHGVVFNFGKPNKPFTFAYYGYPAEYEFELAISIERDSSGQQGLEQDVARTDDTPAENKTLDPQVENEVIGLTESAPEVDDSDLIDFGFASLESNMPQPIEEKPKDSAPIVTENTYNARIRFPIVSPSSIKIMFEQFLAVHAPELNYKAQHASYELHDLGHTGPYQLRIEDEEATSVIATVEEFEGMLNMASTLAESFREKDLIITEEDGSLVC